MGQRNLLTITAALECLAGFALITAPGTIAELLIGSGLNVAGSIVGRIGGFGLLALGVACFGARTEASGSARSGTLIAITLYNISAGLFLIACAAIVETRAIVLGVAGSIHLGLGLAGTVLLRTKAVIDGDCQTVAEGSGSKAAYIKHERYGQ
jgi:hypothetical protein